MMAVVNDSQGLPLTNRGGGELERAWERVFAQAGAHAERLGVHPTRTVILLPFVQLLPAAREFAMCTRVFAGFLPRFETVQSWTRRLGALQPGGLDLRFDRAIDSLTARSLLEQAGLADRHALLTGTLVQAAHELATVAAAMPPAQRADWADRARQGLILGLEQVAVGLLALEQSVARIALEWVAASSYASDVLWSDALRADADALVLVRGVGTDHLAERLCQQHAQVSLVVHDWLRPLADARHLGVHEVALTLEESDVTTACVVQHVSAGRQVALAAVDRMLIRQISSQLVARGLAVNDETGWGLSTTRAAAALISLLRAAKWGSTQAQRIDWLRHTCTPRAQVDALERDWRRGSASRSGVQAPPAQDAIRFMVNGAPVPWPELLDGLRRPRRVHGWLTDLKAALQATGQWEALLSDEAGRVVLQALHLDEIDPITDDMVLSLPEFTRWAQDVLEFERYKPSLSTDLRRASITILPLAQVMARPFDVLVIAGADEDRLANAPEPTGLWTAQQRHCLGLPSRQDMARDWQRAWHMALGVPCVQLLWSRSDGERERVMSPLLARRLMDVGAVVRDLQMPEPRVQVVASVHPVPEPQAVATKDLLVRTERVSQSDYQSLRTCPYRYYALRLLGLREIEELDAPIGKRDFGTWVHEVLRQFHEARPAGQSLALDAQLLDDIAAQLRLPGEGFIPFDAAWPQLREGYLKWLTAYEARAGAFSAAEQALSRELGQAIRLEGRIDRIDTTSSQGLLVMDYKTESESRTRERVREPLEDTQLAFYAALQSDDDSQGLEAAYLNIGEKGTTLVAQGQVQVAREALIDGVRSDILRVRAGTAMLALGEGAVCEYCAARGLCRKDTWS